MSILSFLNPEPAIEVETEMVIINITDHDSLLTGALYALLMEKDGIKTSLVDVRDVITFEYDRYTWIGASVETWTKSYGASLMTDRRVAKYLRKRAVNLIQTHDTLLESMLDRYESMREADDIVWSTSLWRFIQGVETYMTPEIKLDQLEWYVRVIDMAYAAYRGGCVTLSSFDGIASSCREDCEIFLRNQREVSIAAMHRMREVVINGKYFHMLSCTGPEVHGLLRRLKLSKKEWVNVTTGMYGVVAHASVPVVLNETYFSGAILYLAPETEPTTAFGRTTIRHLA